MSRVSARGWMKPRPARANIIAGVVGVINCDYSFTHNPLQTVEVSHNVANEQRRLAEPERNGSAVRIEGKPT